MDKDVLYRVVPVELFGNGGKSVQTYALLDEGSSVSMIDADIANELQLNGDEYDLDLQFANAVRTTETKSLDVTLSIRGMQDGAQHYVMDSVRTSRKLLLPLQTVKRSAIMASNPHLCNVPFATFDNARPKLLIGLDHSHLGVPQQTCTNGLPKSIVGAFTPLGWVLYGSDSQARLPGAVVLHVRAVNEDAERVNDERERFEQLNELVRQHFTTEEFGVKMPTVAIESDEVARARRILESTTKRVGDRFETGLLWRTDAVKLPESIEMAKQRLRSVESKMRKDEEYARQYRQQINAYLEKGYARKLTAAEAAIRSDRTWYLPHFAVQSVNKPGKFRLVFDAAATAHGTSLNSALLSGPDENVPLTRLLFKFRLGAVGVCADIREMYHQVLVRQADQDAQRFLWRDGDASVEPSVYVMNVMTFGSTCSPASAQFVKNKNAMEFAHRYPEAAEAIRCNHYVDDYVASFSSSIDAMRVTEDVIALHKLGGFELRGVISNCAVTQATFGAASSSSSTVELEPNAAAQKILGMAWETDDDTFRFQTRFGKVRADVVDGSKRPTKREILSVSMSIFDPFGMLADFVLPSKIILQELWRTGAAWDDPVSEEIDKRWQAWRAQIPNTRRLRVPRCYSPSIVNRPGLQLHIFADASEVAFAAVAYWRIEADNGVELAFVAGKARCAPLKLLSIPRLELQAAVLATRLMKEIRESHAELTVDKTVFWSDSETVLKWLRCSQRRYKTFVAFRVAEVVEAAPPSWWRWVPTALNVADDATRVKEAHFDPESRWLRGPAWLREAESSWPTGDVSMQPNEDDDDEELRPRFVGLLMYRGAVEYTRFSKYSKLCRCVAWIMRFARNARERRDERNLCELSASEVDRASLVLIRMVQREAFPDELAELESGRQPKTTSAIFTIKPYLDAGGTMRVHGRVDAADERYISSDAKRPILLPRAHYFSTLLVRHYHESVMAHQLVDATIAAVRAKYWVPGLRALVQQVRRDCCACRVRTAMPGKHSQGQLPRDRMDAYARPFTNTGLDFFGPVFVTVGRRHEKRWVALFTCLTVRAVHLEIAADLSTDACLTCIRNLCHIRGVPSLIRCDNGTNFVGARNELARDEQFFDSEAIQRELSTKNIEWRFNCPANPEAGGAWERLVQSVKRVLQVTLKEEAPRVETLRSLLLEAANMVNSRPLTHLQLEPDDPEPITPNHFLIGGPNIATAPDPADAEPRATRKQWKICRGLSRRFWQQFVRDYLPELTRRSRHYAEQPPLCVGDLVIVCDEQQPRGRWARGRVIEVAVAPDGVVRTASVQTANGVLRRPATKLARIDVSPSDGGDVRGAECCIASGAAQ